MEEKETALTRNVLVGVLVPMLCLVLTCIGLGIYSGCAIKKHLTKEQVKKDMITTVHVEKKSEVQQAEDISVVLSD